MSLCLSLEVCHSCFSFSLVLHSRFLSSGLGLRFFVGLIFEVVELLERVPGEAFVFIGVG